jgi:hypothetical protein
MMMRPAGAQREALSPGFSSRAGSGESPKNLPRADHETVIEVAHFWPPFSLAFCAPSLQ